MNKYNIVIEELEYFFDNNNNNHKNLLFIILSEYDEINNA